jgi:hypothetical protein
MSKKFNCSFIQIPQELLEAPITPNAKLLYGVILNMYNCAGIVNPGNSYLGESLNIKESAISKLISELKEHDFISTTQNGPVRTIYPKIKPKGKSPGVK